MTWRSYWEVEGMVVELQAKRLQNQLTQFKTVAQHFQRWHQIFKETSWNLQLSLWQQKTDIFDSKFGHLRFWQPNRYSKTESDISLNLTRAWEQRCDKKVRRKHKKVFKYPRLCRSVYCQCLFWRLGRKGSENKAKTVIMLNWIETNYIKYVCVSWLQYSTQLNYVLFCLFSDLMYL